jgi:predicted dehydrogenase
MSFDVAAHGLPTLEIYGEDGTLSCPDPNRFHEDERIRLFRREGGDWKDVPMSHAHRAGRGLGVADMAVAVRTGREHRCSDERAAHIIEIMEAFERSSQSGAHVLIKSRCSRSTPLPKDLLPGRLD